MKAHIVPRTLCSGAFGRLTLMTKSLSGNWLTIEKENNSLLVGKDSETTMVDIVASNGVIHVIDQPIVPKSGTFCVKKKNHIYLFIACINLLITYVFHNSPTSNDVTI